MEKYYVAYQKELLRLRKHPTQPNVRNFYDAFLIHPYRDTISTVIYVEDESRILELPDDESAKLWFTLKYGE